MAVIIQLRRDTATNWATANPVLANGEEGYEQDTQQRKVGDGVRAWNQLPYLANTPILTFIAGQTLSGHRVVKANGSGHAVYADNTVIGDSQLLLGMTLGAAVIGNSVTIAQSGNIVEPSWSWAPGQPVFLGATGAITQTPPSVGFLVTVGVAMTPTSMLMSLKQPIVLV